MRSREVRAPGPRDRFPREIKLLIADCAAQADAARLARLSSAWQEPAEESIWRDVNIGGHKLGHAYSYADNSASSASVWRDCLDALDLRPIRKRYVRTMRGPSTDRALISICKFAELFRDQLVVVSQCQVDEIYDAQNDGANFARAIDCARFMPNLTTLSLYFQEDWEAELCPALRSTHNLVYLNVWVEFAANFTTTYQPRPTLELPKLRNLVLYSQRWEQGVIHIKNGAPALESLTLGREANDRALWSNAMDDWGEALGMASLRELRVLGKGLSESIVRSTRAAVGRRRSLCPELERIVLALPLEERSLPVHPKIDSIALCSYDIEPFPSYCGSVPSKQVTGLIAPWFIDLIDGLPRLCRLEPWVEPMIPSTTEIFDADLEQASLIVTTYTSETDALYIITFPSRRWMTLLSPHRLSYCRPEYHFENLLFCNDPDAQAGSIEGIYRYDHWAAPELGRRHVRTGDIVMTYYHGYALPWALLNHVLSLKRGSSDFSGNPRSGRGLEMPEEAWQLLQSWMAELVERPWHRTTHERVDSSDDPELPDYASSDEEDLSDDYDDESDATSDDTETAMQKRWAFERYMNDESGEYDSEGNLIESDSEDSEMALDEFASRFAEDDNVAGDEHEGHDHSD